MTLIVAILAALFVSLPATAEEALCTTLDTLCSCSEPLDTDTYVAGPAGAPNLHFGDPADSSTKECLGELGASGGGMSVYPVEDITPKLQADLPGDGLGDALPVGSTVTRVMMVDNVDLKGKDSLAASQRVCYRHYLMYPEGTVFPPTCNHKHMRQSYGGNTQWIFTQQSGANVYMLEPYFLELPQDAYYGTGPLRPSDCIGHWCRVEACTSGNIEAGTDLRFQAYIEAVETDQRVEWDLILGDAQGSGGINPTQSYAKVAEGFAQGCVDPRRLITHAMQVEWPGTNLGTFIGPASEIEGTSGLSVNLHCTPDSGPVNTVPHIDCTVDPLNEGTGPDYRFEIDCDASDGTDDADHAQNRDDLDPVATETFTDICAGFFGTVGDHIITATLKDFEDAEFGGSPAATTTDSFTVAIENQVSQCPEPALAVINSVQLVDGETSLVVDSDFRTGDTIAASVADCAYLEAVGNNHLMTNQGSVKFVIDGTYTWGPLPIPANCQFNAPLHSAGDFQCDTRLEAPGEHTAILTPRDVQCTVEGSACDCGTAGPIRTIVFDTLP